MALSPRNIECATRRSVLYGLMSPTYDNDDLRYHPACARPASDYLSIRELPTDYEACRYYAGLRGEFCQQGLFMQLLGAAHRYLPLTRSRSEGTSMHVLSASDDRQI